MNICVLLSSSQNTNDMRGCLGSAPSEGKAILITKDKQEILPTEKRILGLKLPLNV